MQSPCWLQPFADLSCGLERFPIYIVVRRQEYLFIAAGLLESLCFAAFYSRNSLWKYTLQCEQPVPCFWCDWRQTGLRELNAWNEIHRKGLRMRSSLAAIYRCPTGFVGLAGFNCSLTLNAIQLEFLSFYFVAIFCILGKIICNYIIFVINSALLSICCYLLCGKIVI